MAALSSSSSRCSSLVPLVHVRERIRACSARPEPPLRPAFRAGSYLAPRRLHAPLVPRRSASFAVAAAALSAPPLGCATGLSTAGDDVGGAGGQGGATTVSVTARRAPPPAAAPATTAASARRAAPARSTPSARGCTTPASTTPTASTTTTASAPALRRRRLLRRLASLYPFGEQEFFEYAFCLICTACYTDCEGTVTACKN